MDCSLYFQTMKSLFLIFLLTLTAVADQRYLVTRQPTSTTQVGEVVTVPPNAFFVADGTGRLVPRVLGSVDILGLWGPGVTVSSLSQLKAELVNPATTRIILGSDILVTENLVIPFGKVIIFNGRRLVESSSQTISFRGVVVAGREQIFEGWEPGDITGWFGTDKVFPEWWGLVGSTYADGRHDLAIMCAAKCFEGAVSNKVSLGHGDYWIAKPIDLRGTRCRLEGAGSGSTYLKASSLFQPPAWEDCYQFEWTKTFGQTTFTTVGDSSGVVQTPAGGTTEFRVGRKAKMSGSSVGGYNGEWTIVSVTDHDTLTLNSTFSQVATGTLTPVTLDSVMDSGVECHSSLIWMGGTGYGSTQSFFTGVEGVAIDGWYATSKFPLKRISGISWTGFVEELSPIRDICIVNFSGFGIGGSHPSSVNTINGVSIDTFFFSNATRRGAIPIFMGGHAGVVSIKSGTIDVRVGKAQTEFADVPVAYPTTWPQFGVLAAGAHTVVENVHFEGMCNAVHVFAWEGPGSVAVNDCDMIWGMEPVMGWYDDPARVSGFPPLISVQESQDNIGGLNNFIFHHGCLVSLGRLPGLYQSADNYNSNVVCRNLRTLGDVKYLLRDWVYGVEITSFGGERFPNEEHNVVTSYQRGIPYGLPSGSRSAPGVAPSMTPGAYYNKNAPAVDKTYFSLIR